VKEDDTNDIEAVGFVLQQLTGRRRGRENEENQRQKRKTEIQMM
jgi:hypothetical protein